MGIPEHAFRKDGILYKFSVIASEVLPNPNGPRKLKRFVDEEVLTWVIPMDIRTEGSAAISDWLLDTKGIREEYDRWKDGLGSAIGGTRLTEWDEISPAIVAGLEAAKIYTVEQLADVDDGLLSAIGQNMRPLRDKARAFVAVRSDGADLAGIIESNSKLAADNADMQAKLEALMKEMEEMKAAKAPKVKDAA